METSGMVQQHIRKDEHGKQHGFYMPEGHDNEIWAVTKVAK